MHLLEIAGIVAGAGALGGFGHGLVAGEFALPRFDSKRRVFKPGVVGDVLVGALAALVVWAVYGAAASYDVNKSIDLPLPVAQLGMSIIVGISGAQILRKLAERTAERTAERAAEQSAERVADAPPAAESGATSKA